MRMARSAQEGTSPRRATVLQSGQEKGLIDRYVEAYRQLERAGIVGEEQRISWIDALRAANRRPTCTGSTTTSVHSSRIPS
jgi:hypothetical protein